MNVLRYNTIFEADPFLPFMTIQSEEYLLKNIAVGDQHAMKIVFDRFYGRLYAAAYYIVHDEDVAKDAVQDVFVKFWKHKNRATAIKSLELYLHTAVKNTCLDLLKKKRVYSIASEHDAVDFGENPLKKLSHKELAAHMNKAIEDLPPKCKVIFEKVYLDGNRYKEVSDDLGVSINTVKTQLRIALHRLRTTLEKYKEF